MAYEAFNRKFLNANKLQANSGAQEHFLQHSEASFVSTQLDPFCGMQKAEKISSKFSNCAITRQRKIKKKTKRIRRAKGTKFRLACVRLCRQIN